MKMSKVLAVISMVAVLGTVGGMVFASSDPSVRCPRICPQAGIEQKAEMQSRMQERLSQALEEGKITQEQYDAAISGSWEGAFPPFGRHGCKGERPELSGEQKAEMQSRMQERLAQALEEGKITQEQYDAVISGSWEGAFPPFGRHGCKGERPELGGE